MIQYTDNSAIYLTDPVTVIFPEDQMLAVAEGLRIFIETI